MTFSDGIMLAGRYVSKASSMHTTERRSAKRIWTKNHFTLQRVCTSPSLSVDFMKGFSLESFHLLLFPLNIPTTSKKQNGLKSVFGRIHDWSTALTRSPVNIKWLNPTIYCRTEQKSWILSDSWCQTSLYLCWHDPAGKNRRSSSLKIPTIAISVGHGSSRQTAYPSRNLWLVHFNFCLLSQKFEKLEGKNIFLPSSL